MTKQPFTHHQLFNLKLETLEGRLMEYYQETQDSSMTINLLLVLQVRYQLGAEEFALAAKDLVRHLFLRTKSSKTMKRFFYYFSEYFDTREWRNLGLRLFPLRNFIEKAKSVIQSQLTRLVPAETTVP